MTEVLYINTDSSKEDKYKQLIPQIEGLLKGESNIIANLANTSAALKQTFDFFWVGFYLVEKDSLVLGPFQGTIACTRIKYGKGVCGTAWHKRETIIVENVELFPGHIACDANSKSEIVIPIIRNDDVIAVLDIDSQYLNHFDETDARYLQQVVSLLNF